MSDDIVLQMLSARLPCDCVTKAAEHQLHEATCLYRLFREGVAEIERLRAENRRLRSAGATALKPGPDKGHWVRLMCYFGTDGVWNSDDEQADVSALPFSPGLKDAVGAWLDMDTSSVAAKEKFSAQAITLARQIKSELPHWKVVYVDRSRSGPDIRSKDSVEIEITA